MSKLNYNRDKIEELLIQYRRDLHQIPEIGFELHETVKYVCNVLDEFQIPYKKIVDGSAVVALIEGGKPGRTIALRGDMDGLPIREETNLEFQSTNGNMHACGHDCHTAVLLATGIVLNDNKDQLEGNVKLFFQPSEEINGGAKPMIDEGCLKNPDVDFVLGQHVGVLSEEIEVGQLGFIEGPMLASLDEFRIKFNGQGGHGAYPHNAIDPIPMAASAILEMQTFMARRVDALESAVFTIGQIHGGSQYNIIPENVELNGTVRCLNEKVRQSIADNCEKICTKVAESQDGTCDVEYKFGYPVVVNNPELTNHLFTIAKDRFGDEKVKMMQKPRLGSEDFAYFAQEVPSCFIFINTGKTCDGVIYPNHNPKFMVEESLLIEGVEYFLEATMSLLDPSCPL